MAVDWGEDGEPVRPALADIDVRIEPGTLAALVGPSGAGKTTLTGLVPRFFDPRHGQVLIDGHDLRAVTLESLTRNIGVVFQDTFLFHATVADNLRYARPDATDADLVTAAEAAHLHEFIQILVLDHGRISDQGTHPDLLERGGLYADLYHRQFNPRTQPTSAPTPP